MKSTLYRTLLCNYTMRKKPFAYFLFHSFILPAISLIFSFGQVSAQPYYYATFSGGNCNNCGAANGTGTFAIPTAVPNFTWTATAASNKIRSISYTLGSDEMPDANPWETKYGNTSATTSCLRVRHRGNAASAGDPLGIPIDVTVNFSNPTFAMGWGFFILDMDVDELEIVSATDGANNPVPAATIAGWFKGVFDADLNDSRISGNSEPPCWDAATRTVVGSEYMPSPCAKVTTLGFDVSDYAGAGAYFEPNLSLNSITFRFYNLQETATPSYRLFIAALDANLLPLRNTGFLAVPQNTQSIQPAVYPTLLQQGESIYIDLPTQVKENYSLWLVSTVGRTIKMIDARAGERLRVPTGNLNKGVYFLKIQRGKLLKTYKLTVN
jgi:hypothetical protein